MTRTPFGAPTSTVEYAFTKRPGDSRKARLQAALRDARERFPTAVAINASYLTDLSPSDSQIKVSATIKTSDVPRYYK